MLNLANSPTFPYHVVGSETLQAPIRVRAEHRYPALLVSFGGDTKSRRSILYGVYAGDVKYPTSPHWNV